MNPTLDHRNIKARCPDCGGAASNFLYGNREREYGHILIEANANIGGIQYDKLVYRLVSCSACRRAGVYKAYFRAQHSNHEKLVEFWPTTSEIASLPSNIPDGVLKEYREAEKCASIGAWRAGSALIRSTLEKVLKENGYKSGNLQKKIDEASADGIITESRRKRAHDEIRVLGNDILHDAWMEIPQDDYEASHHYCQRIIEDFYDDRPSVEGILKSKGRIP